MYPFAAPPPPPPRKPKVVPVIAGATAALVLVALGVFVVPQLLSRAQNQQIGDGRPTQTSAPTDSPTPTTGPTTEYTDPPDPKVNCTGGEPLTRRSPEIPDKLTGGGLEAPAAAAWEPLQAPLLFVTDVQAQKLDVSEGWINVIALGSLDRDDGFADARTGARAAMDCLATARGLYPGLTKREQVESRSLEISGHKAWHIRQILRVDQPPGVAGDVVDVIVVEVSQTGPLGFFTASATIGHPNIQSVVDKVAADLIVA